MATSAERRGGARPSELPLSAPRAAWDRVWARLLATPPNVCPAPLGAERPPADPPGHRP